jgi:hypothetical protein
VKSKCIVSAHYKISTEVQYYARLHAYVAASWGLALLRFLRSADWYLVTDVSGQSLGPIFKGPTCSLFAYVSGHLDLIFVGQAWQLFTDLWGQAIVSI